MSTSSWTSVDFFQVSIAGYKNEAELYANGNMQVAICVYIRVVDDNGLPVELIQRDIDALSLVLEGAEKIPDGWSYSQRENRYLHTMPEMTEDTAEEIAQPVPMDGFTFWVSTEKAGSVNLEASIRSPAGIVYKSSNSVPLTGIETRKYTSADMLFIGFNAANFESENGVPIDQDNYYLSLKNNKKIVYVDWMGSDIPLFACGKLKYGEHYPTSFYGWPLDTEVRQSVQNFPEDVSDAAWIVVNDKPGQVCMTRLMFQVAGLSWSSNFKNRVVLSIFDEYGTHGLIEVIVRDDENTMYIIDYSGGGM